MRGGMSKCTLILSDEESRGSPGEGLSNSSDHASFMPGGGFLLLSDLEDISSMNSDLVHPEKEIQDVSAYGIPATSLAVELGKPQGIKSCPPWKSCGNIPKTEPPGLPGSTGNTAGNEET